MFLSAIVMLAFTNLGTDSIAYGKKIICYLVLKLPFYKQKQPSPDLCSFINTGRQGTET